MTRMRLLFTSLAIAAAFASNAHAAGSGWSFGADAPAPDAPLRSTRAWQVTFAPDAEDTAAPKESLLASVTPAMLNSTAEQRTTAVTYSEAYGVRAKIHRIASYATLPLFAGQYYLGTKLEEREGGEPVRWTHAAIATTMVGLFGVNSVTGLWNLWEGRNDPTKRGLRMLHGMLMLGADAGFMATGLLAPTNDGGGNQSLHKSVAITSIAVATTGYLIMLFGN